MFASSGKTLCDAEASSSADLEAANKLDDLDEMEKNLINIKTIKTDSKGYRKYE